MSIKCTCYHPLLGIRDSAGQLTKNGKHVVHIVSHDFFKEGYESALKRSDVIPIPCGKCVGCKLKYARSWANRCMLEASYHSQNWFITLTYDNEHLPYSMPYLDFPGIPTLRPKDFTDFIKRLRIHIDRNYPENCKCLFKYYMCGEYGDKKGRPHYHFLAFGLNLFDLVPDLEKTRCDKYQYISETLNKLWKHGRVRVSEVNWKTCSYVARYVMKKQVFPELSKEDKNRLIKETGFVPPYVRMSNGIGLDYYNDNLFDIYSTDEINLSTPDGGLNFKPPRYFDLKFEEEYPEQMELIRSERESSARLQFLALLDKLEISYYDYLTQNEELSNNKSKALVRSFDE